MTDFLALLDLELANINEIENENKEVKEEKEIYDKENDKIRCSNCNSESIVTDFQEDTKICSNCGLVVEEEIEYKTNDEELTGHEDAQLFDSAFISTILEGGGGKVSHRIHKNHTWNYCNSLGTLPHLYKDVDEICDKLKDRFTVNDVRKTAKLYAKTLLDGNTNIKRNNRLGFLSACVYYAMINNQRLINVNEFCEFTELEKSIILSGFRTFKNYEKERKVRYSDRDNVDFKIVQFGELLGLPFNLIRLALVLYKRIVQMKIVPRDNRSSNEIFAASVLYFTAKTFKNKVRRKFVAETCKLSESGIKSQNIHLNKLSKIITIGFDIDETIAHYNLN